MKDFIGNELQVGDAVATNRDGYTWSLEKVYVIGFTPQKIRLSYKKDEEKRSVSQIPKTGCKNMKPENIVLEGVTGSTAYGLATENSDVDIKGVYLLPTDTVLSIGFDPQHTTKDHTDPDWVYHEVGKFMKLVINGNPTVTELLFLDEYTKLTPVGQLLIDNRSAFLSTKAVTAAYSGYAFSQAKRLNNRTEQGLEGYDSSLKNRFAKHTRHCFRLLMQARQLLETGTLDVKVTPEQREYLFAMGEKTADEVVEEFMRQDTEMKNVKSVLPDEPDYETLNKLLYDIRMQYGKV